MNTKCLLRAVLFILLVVGSQSVVVLPADVAVEVVVTPAGSAGKLLMPQPVFAVASPSQGVVQLSNTSTAEIKLLSGPGVLQGTLTAGIDSQNQFSYYDMATTAPGNYLIQVIITIPGVSSLVEEVSFSIRQVFPTNVRLVTDEGTIGTPNNKLIPQPTFKLVDDIGVASPALPPFFTEVYCIVSTVSPLLSLKRGDTQSNVSADGVLFEYSDLGIDLIGYHELTASVTLVLASGHSYTLDVDNFFVNITKNRAYPSGAVVENPPFGIVNQYLSTKISVRLLGVPDEAKASISLLSGQGKQLDGSVTNVHVDVTKTRIVFDDLIPRVVGVYDIQVIVTLSNGIVYTVPIQFSVAPSENQPDCVCVLQHGSGRIGIPLFITPIVALSSGCLSGSCSETNHLLLVPNSTASISGTNLNGLVIGDTDPTGRFFFHNLTFPIEGNFQLTATVVVDGNSFSVPVFIDISQAIGPATQVVSIQKLSRANDFGDIISPHPEVELLAEGGYPPPATSYQIVGNLRELNYGATMKYELIKGTDGVGHRFVFVNTSIHRKANGNPPNGLYHIDVLVVLPGVRESLRTSIPILISGAITRPSRVLDNYITQYQIPLSGVCKYDPFSVIVANDTKQLLPAKELFPGLEDKVINDSVSCTPDDLTPIKGGEFSVTTSLQLDDGTVLMGEETICFQGQLSSCEGTSNSYLITLLTVIVGLLLLVICYLLSVLQEVGVSLSDLKRKTMPRILRRQQIASSQQQRTEMLEPLLDRKSDPRQSPATRGDDSDDDNEEDEEDYSSEEEEESEEYDNHAAAHWSPPNPMVHFSGRATRGNTILPTERGNRKNSSGSVMQNQHLHPHPNPHRHPIHQQVDLSDSSSSEGISGSDQPSQCNTSEIFVEEVQFNPRHPATPDFQFPPPPHAQLSSIEHRVASTGNNLFSAAPEAVHRPSWSPSVQPTSAERPDFSGVKKDIHKMEAVEIDFWKRALSQLNGGTELRQTTPTAGMESLSPVVPVSSLQKVNRSAANDTEVGKVTPAPPPELLPTLVPVPATIPTRERKSSKQPASPEKRNSTQRQELSDRHKNRRASAGKWSDFDSQQQHQRPIPPKAALTPEQRRALTDFGLSQIKPPVLQQPESVADATESKRGSKKDEDALTVLIGKMDGLTDMLGQRISRPLPSPSVSYTTTTLDDETSFVSSLSNNNYGKPIRTPAPLPPPYTPVDDNNDSNLKNKKRKKRKKKKTTDDDLL